MRRRRYVRPIARRRMRGRSAWKATAGHAAVAIHRPMPQRRHGPARGRMQSLQDAGEPAARCDPPAAGHADLEEGFPSSGHDKAITRVLKLALRATGREKRPQTVPVGRPGRQLRGPYLRRASAVSASLSHSSATRSHASLSSGLIALSACCRASSACLRNLDASSAMPDSVV
jgi:hypothetical protein